MITISGGHCNSTRTPVSTLFILFLHDYEKGEYKNLLSFFGAYFSERSSILIFFITIIRRKENNSYIFKVVQSLSFLLQKQSPLSIIHEILCFV